MRERLVAFYALNAELAHIERAATEPGLRAIRLAWWREALEEIAAGRTARAHPVLQAFASETSEVPAALGEAMQLCEAYEQEASFARSRDVAACVLRAASALCGGGGAELAEAGARAWGAVLSLRACATAERRALVEDASQAHMRVMALAKAATPDLFPAIGYLALTPMYLRRKGAPPTLLLRQLKLVASAATGRL